MTGTSTLYTPGLPQELLQEVDEFFPRARARARARARGRARARARACNQHQ